MQWEWLNAMLIAKIVLGLLSVILAIVLVRRLMASSGTNAGPKKPAPQANPVPAPTPAPTPAPAAKTATTMIVVRGGSKFWSAIGSIAGFMIGLATLILIGVGIWFIYNMNQHSDRHGGNAKPGHSRPVATSSTSASAEDPKATCPTQSHSIAIDAVSTMDWAAGQEGCDVHWEATETDGTDLSDAEENVLLVCRGAGGIDRACSSNGALAHYRFRVPEAWGDRKVLVTWNLTSR